MKVVVCIGSSCHLKGSREVVEKLQNLRNDNDLKDKVTLSGKFCMGNCQNGVSVTCLLYTSSSETSEAIALAAATFISSFISEARQSSAPRKIPGNASTLLIWLG